METWKLCLKGFHLDCKLYGLLRRRLGYCVALGEHLKTWFQVRWGQATAQCPGRRGGGPLPFWTSEFSSDVEMIS